MKAEPQSEFNGLELPQIRRVRELVQRHLSRLNSTTGIFAAESYLLTDGRLSGIKFTLGPFFAQWEWGNREIAIIELDESGSPHKLGLLTLDLSQDGPNTRQGRIAA